MPEVQQVVYSPRVFVFAACTLGRSLEELGVGRGERVERGRRAAKGRQREPGKTAKCCVLAEGKMWCDPPRAAQSSLYPTFGKK